MTPTLPAFKRDYRSVPKPGSKIEHISDVIKKPFNARAVQVHVWKNDTVLGVVPDANRPGHASMQVYENGEPVRLISWWPVGSVGKHNRTKKFPGTDHKRLSIDGFRELKDSTKDILQKAKLKGNNLQQARPGQYLHRGDQFEGYNTEFTEQKARWMKLPEVSVSIPGMGAANRRWGLHLPSIANWWDGFSGDTEQKYIMQSKTNNCSGAVAGALNAGGAAWFVPEPIAVLCITPRFIADWSHRLEERISTIEENTKALQSAIAVAGPGLNQHHLPLPLPKKDEWIKATFLAHKPRSLQLQAIDRALSEPFTETFSDHQQKRLVILVEAIYNHISKNTNSDRRMWVLCLARLALALVSKINQRVGPVMPLRREPAPEAQKPAVNRFSPDDDDGDWSLDNGDDEDY